MAPTTETVWVSAFNTLYEREVPPTARRPIFEVLASTGATRVITETHPATVRASIISEVATILKGATLGVQFGVETMDQFVRYACMNKPFNNAVLGRAVRTIHDAGAEVYANLLVGIPFLSERDVIDDIAWSVQSCLEIGCDYVVLFPNYVKDHTLAELLLAGGRYAPPDVWTLRDVLGSVPRVLWPALHIGWLDVKDHPGAARVLNERDVATSAELTALLRQFDHGRDLAALDRALSLHSPREEVSQDTDTPLPDRVLDHYEWLANHHMPPLWWNRYGDAVSSEIRTAFEGFAGPAIKVRDNPPGVP